MGLDPVAVFVQRRAKTVRWLMGSPGMTRSILHWRLPPSICQRWSWRTAHHPLFEQTPRQQGQASSLESEWFSLARVFSFLLRLEHYLVLAVMIVRTVSMSVHGKPADHVFTPEHRSASRGDCFPTLRTCDVRREQPC